MAEAHEIPGGGTAHRDAGSDSGDILNAVEDIPQPTGEIVIFDEGADRPLASFNSSAIPQGPAQPLTKQPSPHGSPTFLQHREQGALLGSGAHGANDLEAAKAGRIDHEMV